MSVEAMTTVLHHSRHQGAAKLVLLGIANHQGDGGAWPTRATLCKYAGLGGRPENQARTMRRILRQLIDSGELKVDVNQGGTPDREWWERPNLYRVLVVCPPSCDGTMNHRERRTEQPRLPVENEGLPVEIGGGQSTPGGSVNPGGEGVRQPPKPSTTNPDADQVVTTVTDPRARRADPETARRVAAETRKAMRLATAAADTTTTTTTNVDDVDDERNAR